MSIDLYNFDVNELQLYVDNLSLNEHEPSSSPPLTPHACPDDLALISHPTSDVHCFSTPIDSQDIPFVGVGWGYAFLGQQWPALDAELWDATTQQEHTWADSVINNFTCTPSDIYASSQSSSGSSSGYQTTSSKKSTTVKIFSCSSCPRTFVRNYDLSRHKRSHSGVKPFPCFGCSKKYRRSDALQRHWVKTEGCVDDHEAAVGKLAKKAKAEGRLKKKRPSRSNKPPAGVLMRLTKELCEIYGNETLCLIN